MQGGLGRDERYPVIRNCGLVVAAQKSLGSTNPVEVYSKKSVVPVATKTKESTASRKKEGKLLRRYCKDMVLKETTLDIASPTGVKG